MHPARRHQSAFSLLELVLVVAIIGIVAAVAVPRVSRGAAGSADGALRRDLATLRHAIEFYAIEHGGVVPEKDSTLADQLMLFTNFDGETSAVRTTTHRYGPYLAAMPPLPVGKNRGSRDVRDGGNVGDGSEGWFYEKNTGAILANTKDEEVDAAGVPYNTY